MDLLNIIINSKNLNSACFLCFICDDNNLDICTVFEIRNEYDMLSISLAEMYKNLFPNQDLVFGKACNDCSDLITALYILFHKRKTKTIALNCIAKDLVKKIDEICRTKVNNGKIMLSVDLPSYQHKDDGKNRQDLLSNQSFICMLCTNSFESAEKLNYHQTNDHNVDVKSDVPQAPQLNVQQKRKRKRKYHYCNDCEYKTLSKSTLQAHMNRKHLCTRPHICQICYKGFYKNSNLNEHVKTHDNKRNEICELCGCSFLHKKNLIEHLRLHSDTRPYECTICSKKFVTSGRRSDHMKRSHMERNECCLICNKRYSLKKELTRHINNVHLKSL